MWVVGTAYDGEGTNKPDRFSIECRAADGEVVFEAKGEVTSGDVLVDQLD